MTASKMIPIAPPIIVNGDPVWDFNYLLLACWAQVEYTGRTVSMADMSDMLTAKYEAKVKAKKCAEPSF